MSKEFEYDENDTRTYEEQYDAWLLCADTVINDISSYPGRGDEQKTARQYHKVVTKRSRSHE